MKIEFSERFVKSYTKPVSRRPEAAVSVLEKVVIFANDPFSRSLALH